ncbi:zinc transport system substrate-binding protein [Geopseudomonas sagittaria]|uniref:High-affinity zinc uptake system protein ZnuA n=1 Tax=Geopseudomonas sagittaria TaxID=1135990 RepID=A0A1I5Y841_9GAMM|nr:zinc ABC transporter substrate-binding protein ZnuA [Pseudomonas sagittaria]SFQ40358.1 zinc transport system substrate-binding protein [Pseudomonas sagittaria]
MSDAIVPRLSSLLPAAALAAALSWLLATPALAEVRVLTSIKPLQLIAAAVQDGAGTPEVLLPPGASPHHYALRPSDIRRVREADLLYWIGPDLEVFLPRVLEGREQPSLAVQGIPGLHLRHFGEAHRHADEQHAEEHDEHAHEEHAAEEHAGHGHDDHADADAVEEHDAAHRPGSLDAHLWLLPANARVIAARMAADLAKADPANAARYQANLAAFEQRLAALDDRLRARLAPLKDKPFFVFHEAFDYFEEAYGLQHAGVFAVSAEVQPGARHVAAMREQLQAAGPSCVFSEPPLRPRLAQTLSAGLPVRLAELDALGFALQAEAGGYERLLEKLGDGLAGCLEKL